MDSEGGTFPYCCCCCMGGGAPPYGYCWFGGGPPGWVALRSWFFLLRRMRKNAPRMRRPRTARPPTTPPTMAPMGAAELLPSEGLVGETITVEVLAAPSRVPVGRVSAEEEAVRERTEVLAEAPVGLRTAPLRMETVRVRSFWSL